MGSLTLLPGAPGLPWSYARLEIGPCSMIVSKGASGWVYIDMLGPACLPLPVLLLLHGCRAPATSPLSLPCSWFLFPYVRSWRTPTR